MGKMRLGSRTMLSGLVALGLGVWVVVQLNNKTAVVLLREANPGFEVEPVRRRSIVYSVREKGSGRVAYVQLRDEEEVGEMRLVVDARGMLPSWVPDLEGEAVGVEMRVGAAVKRYVTVEGRASVERERDIKEVAEELEEAARGAGYVDGGSSLEGGETRRGFQEYSWASVSRRDNEGRVVEFVVFGSPVRVLVIP